MSEHGSWRGGRHRPGGAAYSDDDQRGPAGRDYENGSAHGPVGSAGYGNGSGDPGYGGLADGYDGYDGYVSGGDGTDGYGAGWYDPGAGYAGRDARDWRGYPEPGTYGELAGYGNPGGYGDSGDSRPADHYYGSRPDYGSGSGYGADPGYGAGSGYGSGPGYGAGLDYGREYDAGHGYGAGSGYAGQGYREGTDYGASSGYLATDPAYGSTQGYGSGYSASGYDRADPGYDADHGYGLGPRYADEAGYASVPAGYREAGFGRPDADEPGYGEADYRDCSSDPAGYGQSGASGPGRHSASAISSYPGSGYGDASDAWPGEYGASATQHHALGPASVNDDSDSLSGVFDRRGAGAEGTSAWALWPGTGPLGNSDADPPERRAVSTADRADSDTFRGSLALSSSADESADAEVERSGALGSSLEDTGSIRWSAGPPPARPRAERKLEDAMPGPVTAEPDGSADWQNEPPDDDWPDDAGNGLLSRRFGRDGSEPPGKPPARTRAHGKKRRTGRGKAAVTIAIAVVVLIVGIAAAIGYNFVHRLVENRYGDYAGNGYGSVHITVAPNANLTSLGPLLLRKGVIKALRPYDSAASAASNAGSLQPGVYTLHHHMNASLAVKLLLNPSAATRVTFQAADGERALHLAFRLHKLTTIPVRQFMNLIDHPAKLGLPSWAAGRTAEGFLYPDTYYFQPHESALQILQAMVADFNQRTTNLAAQARKVYTTPWHALIVASLIQAEAGSRQDMPKISRVIWNRLKIGKPLEFDSTVFYAMKKFGTAITQAQEHFRSPYNTYLHTGLPPGPIGSPNQYALHAAVHPAKGNWLYFITDTKRKPYKTYFTNSLKQLQAWQQKFGN